MLLVCPYEPQVHPLTASSLKAHVPSAEYRKIGTDRTGYWQMLTHLWAQGESFILVEHDVEIHGSVFPEFLNCWRPWCVFPYSGPPILGGGLGAPFERALGCTRFRSDLLREHPQLISSIGLDWRRPEEHRDWRGLDARIASALDQAGEVPHVHSPPVRHHHQYPQGCACGEDHE